MKYFLSIRCLCMAFLFVGSIDLYAQIGPKTYHLDQEIEGNTIHRELKIGDDYLVLSSYREKPAGFISTVGGFYTVKNDSIEVKLEFNSNYENDSIAKLKFRFEPTKEGLLLDSGERMEFLASETVQQELDGLWLFGTRGPDKGQERRGDSKARKTLKFLLDGRFQWIAYNIETMAFFGTGGGSFTSKDGVYQENIAYFSRDNSRVGAELKFNYRLEGSDWHHKGNNSKGEPMYEIWMQRE